MTDERNSMAIMDAFKCVNIKVRRMLLIFCKELNLTPTQLDILMQLHESGACKIGDLSAQCLMVESNVSSTCSRLEKLGLVERIRQTDDQRTVKVGLTDLAKSRMIYIVEIFERFKNDVMRLATEEEILNVRHGLESINSLLDRVDFELIFDSLRKPDPESEN